MTSNRLEQKAPFSPFPHKKTSMKSRFFLCLAAVLSAGLITASADISRVSGSSAKSTIAKSSKVVVVDFYADWCGPCKALKPHLDALQKQYGDQVTILSVNVDKDSKFSAEHGVNAIPHVKFFKAGKEVDEFVGYKSQADVEKKIKKALK